MHPGAQLAQACHCCFEFSKQFPALTNNWMTNSNYLAILAVKNEDDLIRLIHRLEQKQVRFAVFREPDFNNEITAVAVEPSPISKKLTSSIPLALKNIGLLKEEK